jgi:hypothetical protein
MFILLVTCFLIAHEYRIEDLDTYPSSYAHLIFDKSPKTYNGERQLLQQMLLENWISACRKLKLDPCLSPCTSINSKWIKDLNKRRETLKLVQERAGSTLGSNRHRQDLPK